MSADDIEAGVRELRTKQLAAEQAEARRRAAIMAEGAQSARSFMDLMIRKGVQPEPIYAFRQLNSRAPEKGVVEVFQHFVSAWVITFSFDPNEDSEPRGIQCLQPDGKVFPCFAREINPSVLPVSGLVANPRKIALAKVPGVWALYLTLRDDDTIFQYDPKDPQYQLDTYVKAAGWYI